MPQTTPPTECDEESDAEKQFADADAIAMRTLGAFLLMQTHRACSIEGAPAADLAACAVADADAVIRELSRTYKKTTTKK